MTRLGILVSVSLVCVGLSAEQEGGEKMSTATVLPGVTLKIVYNNYAGGQGLTADWGFACVVEGGEKPVLFDTGTQGSILMANLKQMDIDPHDVAAVVLSHIHTDHTGGLDDFLKANPQVTVFVPPSFPPRFIKTVERADARCVAVKKGQPILPGLWSTGELGTGIKEQALVAATADGLVVVTGCAHPGVVEMVRGAKEVAAELGLESDDVALVTGGFHMLQMNDEQIKRTIDELRALRVRRAAPSHCSGDRTRALFKQILGADYVVGDLGSTITVGRPTAQ